MRGLQQDRTTPMLRLQAMLVLLRQMPGCRLEVPQARMCRKQSWVYANDRAGRDKGSVPQRNRWSEQYDLNLIAVSINWTTMAPPCHIPRVGTRRRASTQGCHNVRVRKKLLLAHLIVIRLVPRVQCQHTQLEGIADHFIRCSIERSLAACRSVGPFVHRCYALAM